MRTFFLTMCIVLILVNALNIDYDRLFDWTANRVALLNLIIGFLLLYDFSKTRFSKIK